MTITPESRSRPGLLVDVAIAAAALAGTLALVARGGLPVASPDARELDALGVLLAVCASLPIVAWRRFPVGVFVGTALPSVLLAALGYRPGLALGPAIALYLLAAGRDTTRPWTWRTTTAVVSLFAAWVVATGARQDFFAAGELFHGGLAFATCWFAGERTRLRREHIAELEARADRAERETESERRLAIAEERARIARDLHDSAGHAINVIGVLAGAARLRHDDDPERTRRTLETIEEVARQTVGELDQILHTLRDGTSDVAAPHGLASLETLIAHHTTAGLHVTIRAAGPQRPLAASVDQAAFRILQEALTNAARHGSGTARVELTFRDEGFELIVSNPVRSDDTQHVSGGHGLIGMHERATLTGGSLHAGRINGSFRVHAALPYGALRP